MSPGLIHAVTVRPPRATGPFLSHTHAYVYVYTICYMLMLADAYCVLVLLLTPQLLNLHLFLVVVIRFLQIFANFYYRNYLARYIFIYYLLNK